MASQEHILIVGAGIFGASTAYHLTHPTLPSSAQAPRGQIPRVTLLDGSPLGAGIGASEDINKIIRADYSQKFYMDLGYEAIDAWKSLSRPGGILEGLYHQTGWIVLDEEKSDDYARIRKLYSERGIILINTTDRDPTETISLEKVKNSYSGILKDADMSGYRSAYANPEAGWADAGIAVKRIIEESIRVGLQYRVGDVVEVVLGSQSRVRGVRLATGEVVEADKIVLATGAWTSFLMDGIEEKLLLSHEERIERQLTAAGVCVAHYQLTEEEAKVYSEMPVIVNGEKGEVIPPSTSGTLKFTCTGSFTNTIKVASGQSISVPPPQDQSIVPQVLKNEILGIIKSLMPQFEKNGREVGWWRLCWDSITPTQNQLICQHPYPSLHNLYLAVGGSFHSYKFLPTIGKYVANVIQGASNGDEKDRAWEWKQTGSPEKPEMAHANVIPRRQFKDLVHTGSK